jgi:TRAP-type mannitol/chloroaromatic compound transport system permease large subunit
MSRADWWWAIMSCINFTSKSLPLKFWRLAVIASVVGVPVDIPGIFAGMVPWLPLPLDVLVEGVFPQATSTTVKKRVVTNRKRKRLFT